MTSDITRTGQLPIEYVTHLRRKGFELTSLLGQGLSGSVYRAHQPSLDRSVAVKFFDSAFVRSDVSMRKRFVREARILARFQHPNVPYVLTEGNVDTDFGGSPYFVMEYVQGMTLRQLLLRDKVIESSQALEIAHQVLDALSYAHERRIIHRDVKPANVMIDDKKRCFLIDFSIGVSLKNDPGLTRATSSGELLGTPPYCSPEQLDDASNLDGRSDIFSVGVMLVEMLTGSTDLTNISRILSGMPRTLVESIEKACAQSTHLRHGNAAEFMRALGSRNELAPPRLSPALALCANTKCSAAQWTEQGYYSGPKFDQESTSSFCTSCGGSLIYTCRNCSTPISQTPFCGNCGHEIYGIPECKACGSWLKKLYMDANTELGCSKCSTNPQGENRKKTVDDFDDDIPF
jgi:eukaryotic-like serine/threonine-protein kinase